MTKLTAIEAMLAKCTPGEWTVRKMRGEENKVGHGFVQAPRINHSHGYDIEVLCEDANYPDERREGDLQLIARAPSLLRELIERVRAMEKVVAVAETIQECYPSEGSYVCEYDDLQKALAEYRALESKR